jgi:hypothetical protein
LEENPPKTESKKEETDSYIEIGWGSVFYSCHKNRSFADPSGDDEDSYIDSREILSHTVFHT